MLGPVEKNQDLFDRGKLLTSKLLSQDYFRAKLLSKVKMFNGRHYDLVDPYNVKLISDLMTSVEANIGFSFSLTYSTETVY